jgi:hypothetical protein
VDSVESRRYIWFTIAANPPALCRSVDLAVAYLRFLFLVCCRPEFYQAKLKNEAKAPFLVWRYFPAQKFSIVQRFLSIVWSEIARW